MNRHRLPILTAILGLASLPQVSIAQAPPTYTDHANLLVVKDGAGELVPVKSPADWAVRRAHILANLESVMGPLPGGERRVPLDVRVTETVETPKFTRYKITYASEPGDRVPAWLTIPKGVKGKAPAMLCLHQTTGIGKNEPMGLGGLPNLHYAQELAERGYVTISPDYPNFGDYKVNPYELGYASASMKGIWNHMRAVDVLQSRAEVDPEAIGVIGHSLGGHNSIFVALFDPRIKVIVPSCGFNAFTKYMDGNISGWSHKGYMPRLLSKHGLDLKSVPFDFPELIGALAPRPFFTNSPTKDDNFDVEGVRDCIKAAEPIYRLLGAPDKIKAAYPDAKHDFPKAERDAAYGFIDTHLKK